MEVTKITHTMDAEVTQKTNNLRWFKPLNGEMVLQQAHVGMESGRITWYPVQIVLEE
jgi:hypothetical protein